MTFRTTIEVRFGDVDQAGIVYYPVIFHYCHVAFEDFFAGHIGTPYPVMIKERRIGFPAVHIETDFERPFTYGMKVVVEVCCDHVGRTSARFVYRFLDPDEGKTLAKITNTTVCVDMDTLEKQVIPEDCRASLQSSNP